ncbi:MAG: ABC transporter ATP-binding protein [Candidatus Stahlbacteria bacterium]|nr:MAG: ABC transporter ATP-binding protein [Candidatus Stahlbacteria bacterium]
MLRKLGRYLFEYKALLISVLIIMMIVAILSGFTVGMITPIVSSLFGSTYASSGPWIFRWLIKWVTQGDRLENLIKLAISLILIYGIKFPFSLLLYYLSDSLEQRTIADIRVDMFGKLTNLSYRFHSETKSGELLSKITNDTEKIRFALRRGVIHLGQNMFLLVVYLGLALWASWRLFFLALLLTPFTLLVIQFIGKKVRGKFTTLRKERAFLNTLASEMLHGIKIIKSFGMERYELDRFKEANVNYRKNYVKSHLLKAFLPASSELMGAVLAGGILVLGGILIFRGVITPDRFLVFLGSIILVQQPIRQLNLAYGDLQHGLASMESALEIIEATDIIRDEGKEILKSFGKAIRFEDVSFSYDESKPILKNLNLKIKKGETVALVGPSGGGKTTLVNLIPRFFDPVSGVIEIDGKDIRSFSLDSLRKKIGIVTQDVILFNDSVRNNILYGNPKATKSKLNESIKKSHLTTFVSELKKGLETEIGEKGERISGGEKQRIAIARAILKNPPILILDEATSSLDAVSEKLLQDAMAELLKGRTAIIIAHRLSTVRCADRIIVLSKGEVVEEGNHSELLKKNGLYAQHYTLQFKE